MPTLGERLVHRLEAYGVSHVFGIPGVHTVEMYRGLATSRIAHVTPRHEQGAGFMADGYARATGRPGVAFVITGPGLTNTITAMAQAHADSVPMLVVSSVNRRRVLGLGRGDLHEVHRQGALAEHACAFSHTITDPDQLDEVLARAWAVFEGARPRPVHIEIPLDLFAVDVAAGATGRPAPMVRPAPDPQLLAIAAEALSRATRPVILVGGGAVDAGTGVRALAERLGAPVVMTTNGRGVLGHDHPLAVSASPSLEAVHALIGGADVVLAIGTEIGPTDYDFEGNGMPPFPETLIRIEIDAEQMRRGAVPAIPLLGDAVSGVAALLERLIRSTPAEGTARAAEARQATAAEITPAYARTLQFLATVREALPGAPIVGDSAQSVYAGNIAFGMDRPRRWFNAATGYGALGYGLPAAIGAAIGTGGPAVCLAGDGGLQFTLAELGTAVEERLPLILMVWDNKGYGEIKSYMVGRGITPVGVDLVTPDFVALGAAYGAASVRLTALAELPSLLADASGRAGPTVITFDESVVLG